MNLLKKDNDIRDIYEKMEKVQNDYDSIVNLKESMNKSIENLNEKIYQMKIEIVNKDSIFLACKSLQKNASKVS